MSPTSPSAAEASPNAAAAPATEVPLTWRSIGGNNAKEIGGNTHYFRSNDHAVLVDLGLSYGKEACEGFDRALPDVTNLLPLKGTVSAGKPPGRTQEGTPRIEALVVTHGHGDHIGGIPPLVDYLRRNDTDVEMPPIYASGFTIGLIEQQLAQAKIPTSDWPEIHELPAAQPERFGDLTLTGLGASHSLPGCYSLVIETPDVRHFHSGDIKADQTVLLGAKTDFKAIEALATDGKGFTSMGLDSTRADQPGRTPSMRQIGQIYGEILDERPDRRLVVGIQSANFEEMLTIATEGARRGKALVFAGSSLARMLSAAKLAGVDPGEAINKRLRNAGEPSQDIRFLDIASQEAQDLDPRDTMVFAAGANGHVWSALPRAARGQHKYLQLKRGQDMVVLASNSPWTANSILSHLKRRRLEHITSWDERVHASGHGQQGDLTKIAQAVNPDVLFPIHGSPKLLRAHAQLAAENGHKAQLVGNGADVTISRDGISVGEAPKREHWIGIDLSDGRPEEVDDGMPAHFRAYTTRSWRPALETETEPAQAPGKDAEASKPAGP